MSYEAMASDIAHRHHTTLRTLQRSGRHRVFTNVRREIASALIRAKAPHGEIGRILGRHKSIVWSLLWPERHKMRCNTYTGIHRPPKQRYKGRKIDAFPDYETTKWKPCERCGLRGDHVCLAGDASHRREVEW